MKFVCVCFFVDLVSSYVFIIFTPKQTNSVGLIDDSTEQEHNHEHEHESTDEIRFVEPLKQGPIPTSEEFLIYLTTSIVTVQIPTLYFNLYVTINAANSLVFSNHWEKREIETWWIMHVLFCCLWL